VVAAEVLVTLLKLQQVAVEVVQVATEIHIIVRLLAAVLRLKAL
jgi:hypothetical protein